jgi:iron complex outermembrane receptor protein
VVIKRDIRSTASAIILTMGLMDAASMAQAQTMPADGSDIVVTARRSSEKLKDVPASISVIDNSTIKNAGVVTITQMTNLVSGMTIVANTSQVGDTQINIRGINGARDAESNVALVVDGILKTNTSALNQYQGDLQQVEILKGPQGAYYGRNAAAGAIVMTTKAPGDMFVVEGRASYATQDTRLLQGSVSGPISETAGFVLSGDYRSTDGFYRNTGPTPATRGHSVDDSRNWNIGGRIVLTPTDADRIDLKARYGKIRATPLAFDAVFALPGFAGAFGNPLFDEDVNDHKLVYNRNIRGANRLTSKEASAKFSHDMGWATLTSWVSYSNIREDLLSDAAAGSLGRFNQRASCRASVAALSAAGVQLPQPQFLAPTPEASILGAYTPTTCDGIQYTVRNQKDVSGEIRLASNPGGPLSWFAGAYYLHINRHFGTAINEDQGLGALRSLYNGPASINPTSLLFDDRYKTNVYAGFGSLEYALSDRLTFSGALRFDREDRKVDPLVPNVIDPITNGPINPGFSVGAIVPKSRKYQQLQPKVAIRFKASDELNLFADWGVGFKAGGFNSQGSTAIIDQNFNGPLGSNINISDDYRKERSSAYEAGFKASLFDRRLTMDGAVYYTTVHDMQFFEFYTGNFGILRVVSNIDKVRLYGAEMSLSYRVVPGWTLFANGNVTRSKILKNNTRADTVGNKSPNTSDYTINLGTQMIEPIGEGLNLTFRADYRITGPTWFSTVQNQTKRSIFDLFFPGLGTGEYAKSRRDAYGILDLRAGVQAERWSLTGFVRNLTKKKYLTEVVVAPEFGGEFVSQGEGRTIGLELGWRL